MRLAANHPVRVRLSRALAMLGCAAVLVATLGFLLPMTPAIASEASGPELSQAECAIIVDSSGNVLYEKNFEQEMSPASITKVMTAMVALDSGVDLDKTVMATTVDLGSESQAAGYKKGDKTTLRSLLQVMLVFSGNDAATLVARAVAGNEGAFVRLMNEKAEEIGMTHTHFTNCHGLEDEGRHYSCAADLVKMGRYALEHYPFIAATVTMGSVTATVAGSEVTFESTDELLDSCEGMLGIKTGSVESGTTFLGACERGGIRFYTAVLGCDDNDGRFADTRALLDWAFSNCERPDFGRDEMVVRFAPYAFDLSLRVPVFSASSVVGLVRRDGDPVAYSSTRLRAGQLVRARQPYGTILWSQGEHVVGGSLMAAGSPIAGVPAYGPFTSLLFINKSALIEAA